MASSSRHPPARSLLALFGPTASGKTAVAGVLRERIGASVVSADSAALYAGLPVITAAPSYPAALVGVLPLDADVSVGAYQRLAHAAVDAVDLPLVVGGTGLYFRAALSAIELPPPPAPGRREHWQEEVDRLGPDGAHALLAERDPAAAARVHANDRKRLVRALELAEAGSSLAPRTDRLWTDGHPSAHADRRPRRPVGRARPPHRRAGGGDGGGRRRGGGEGGVGPAAVGHRAEGARPRAVRDPARERGRGGSGAGHP